MDDVRLRNARVLDLATGLLADPADLFVAEGRLVRHCPGTDDADVDLAGRVVMPGLWDAHVHMTQWALARSRVNLSAAHDASDCLQRLTAADSGQELLLGQGFRDATWPDGVTDQLVQDRLGDRAAVAISGDLHSAWVTPAARRQLGLPDGPLRVVEQEAFSLEQRVTARQAQQVEDLVGDACAQANRLGVVGITDMEMDWSIDTWRGRSRDGRLGLRVRPCIYPADLDRAVEQGLWTGATLDDTGLVTMGGLKVIVDGSLTARTAWVSEPYPDGAPDPHGICNVPADELEALLERATRHGLDCAVHAIGDAAAAQVLDAFEATGARGSVEHAQLVRLPDVERMAALGLRASVQPSHLPDDAGAMDRLWPNRTADAFSLATMRVAGVELAFGSDAPVAPLNPWHAIADAVLREADGVPWHPEQRISLSAALMASTNRVARLVPGAPADLCVLDESPFDVDPEYLSGYGAWLTMVAGRIVHRTA